MKVMELADEPLIDRRLESELEFVERLTAGKCEVTSVACCKPALLHSVTGYLI
jgi:hypothetical protein